jgi:hypothetical protein
VCAFSVQGIFRGLSPQRISLRHRRQRPRIAPLLRRALYKVNTRVPTTLLPISSSGSMRCRTFRARHGACTLSTWQPRKIRLFFPRGQQPLVPFAAGSSALPRSPPGCPLWVFSIIDAEPGKLPRPQSSFRGWPPPLAAGPSSLRPPLPSLACSHLVGAGTSPSPPTHTGTGVQK